MKRKLPDHFNDDDLEIDFLDKMPQIEGEEKETDTIEYRFEISLKHIASVNFLFSKCLEYLQEEVVKTYYRNCAGERYFADIMEKYLFGVFPYCSATRVKLSCMVSQVVRTIYDWIRHVDRTIFNVRWARQSIALEFVHHIVITSRGTINYAKSAESLLSDPKFDDFDRLKIVCVHCLERYIFAMVNRVPMSENLKKTFAGTAQMIEFWRGTIASGEFMRSVFYNAVDEKIYNAVGVTNTEAIKVLWTRTNFDERNRILIKLIRRSGADVQCWLLSQINGDEQQKVFKACGGVVLNNVFEDYTWGRYVLTTAYHARKVIPSRQYYEFMKRITFCLQFEQRRSRNEIIFRQLWRYATKRITDLIFRHENSHIFYWFRNDINAEYMMALFSDASIGFKQNFILSASCTKACMELIKNCNLNVLETVMKKTYNDDDEKYNFKQILLNDERCKDVVCHLINAGDRTKFDSIMKWFFRSENETKAYKKAFSTTSNYLNIFKDVLNRAVFENVNEKKVRDEIDFTELDEKIECVLSAPEEMVEFKEEILSTSDSFAKSIHQLVIVEQYGLAEQLFCWCIRDPSRVADCKENLYNKRTKAENVEVAFNLLWKNDEFKSLNDFIAWCFGANEAKIREFKESLLSAFKEAQILWGSLLYREEFEFAEQLFVWLGKTTDFEILQYKNELLLNLDLEYVTDQVRYVLDVRDGEHFGTSEADRLLKGHRLIRWLSPTIETYNKFTNLLFVDQLKYSKYCNLIRMYFEENEIDGFVL